MMPPLPPHAYLFTDGSSGPHEDTGAWAAIAVAGTNRKLLFGVQSPTSISRCELIPIIEGAGGIVTAWDGGSAITLTAVPEPSTYGFGLGALALAAAAIRRRKRQAKA
jgi:MYXO-CTERM domain-containing protein